MSLLPQVKQFQEQCKAFVSKGSWNQLAIHAVGLFGLYFLAADLMATGGSKLMLEVAVLAFGFAVALTQLKKAERRKASGTKPAKRANKLTTTPTQHVVANGSRTVPSAAAGPTSIAASRGTAAALETHVEPPRARMSKAIHEASQRGDIERAERLFDEMLLCGMPPDSGIFNSLIHACAKRADTWRAQQWLEKMLSSGTEPNSNTYNIIMDSCVKADDPHGAEAWFDNMLARGIEPDEVSYTTVIYAHAKHGNVGKARRWMKVMRDNNVEPNIVTYNSLIHACSRAGDAVSAEAILLDVLSQGVAPQVATFTAVIDACAKSSDIERAERCLDAMHKNDIPPNVVTYSSMIDVCAKASEPTRAQMWFDNMIAAEVKPNVVSFNALLGAFASDFHRCKEIFQQMEAHGTPPNVISYTTVASPLAYRGRWEDVEALSKEMQSKGLKINDYFLYALISSYGKAKKPQVRRAEQAFLQAVRDGVKVNKFITSALGKAVGPARCSELLAQVKH